MPIQSNTPAVPPNVAPVVQLPVTGVDPTAQAAAVAATAAPVVVAPVLSAADAALIAATQAQFAQKTNGQAGNEAAQAGATTGEGSPAAGAGEPATQPPELTASQRISAKIYSKRAQVAKLNAEIEKLEGQFRSADLLDSIKAGSVIKARVGRAETARDVTASVVGVQTLESGDLRYKVYFGEGFDAETVVIQSSQIIDVVQV